MERPPVKPVITDNQNQHNQCPYNGENHHPVTWPDRRVYQGVNVFIDCDCGTRCPVKLEFSDPVFVTEGQHGHKRDDYTGYQGNDYAAKDYLSTPHAMGYSAGMQNSGHKGFSQVNKEHLLNNASNKQTQATEKARAEKGDKAIKGSNGQGKIGNPALADDTAGHEQEHEKG